MSTEELLKPRYKVIADYPFSGRNINDVFEPNLQCHIDFLNKYPHLFKKLEWWEERQIEEMPEYVKHNPNGKVRKVSKYYMGIYQMEFEGGRTRYLNVKWLPATNDEFNVEK